MYLYVYQRIIIYKNNINNICNNIKSLKDNFKTIFIITHIDELKMYSDSIININKTNQFSNINMNIINEENPPEKQIDYSKLTIIQLKQTLDEKNIKYKSGQKKQYYIDLL